MICQTCCEPMDDGMCYDCEWFFKKVDVDVQLLCPQCRQPFSENKICEDCGCLLRSRSSSSTTSITIMPDHKGRIIG